MKHPGDIIENYIGVIAGHSERHQPVIGIGKTSSITQVLGALSILSYIIENKIDDLRSIRRSSARLCS